MNNLKRYRFLSNVDIMSATFAKILTQNDQKNLVSKLFIEGAALNLLGSQIKMFHNETQVAKTQQPLSKIELKKLVV